MVHFLVYLWVSLSLFWFQWATKQLRDFIYCKFGRHEELYVPKKFAFWIVLRLKDQKSFELLKLFVIQRLFWNQKMKFLSIVGNSFGCSASGERLVSAARDGDLQEAKALLEYNPRLVRYSTFGVRNSPLHYSAAQGHDEVFHSIFNLSWKMLY